VEVSLILWLLGMPLAREFMASTPSRRGHLTTLIVVLVWPIMSIALIAIIAAEATLKKDKSGE